MTKDRQAMLLILLSAIFRPLRFFVLILLSSAQILIPDHLPAAQCQSTTFATPYRSQEQKRFNPEQTIYFYLYCDQLNQTDNTVVIDYISPAGTIRGQTIDSFTTSSPGDIFQKVFAVKLPKKGFVSQALTGVRYGDELYGSWTCRVHLNGILLDRNGFIIH